MAFDVDTPPRRIDHERVRARPRRAGHVEALAGAARASVASSARARAMNSRMPNGDAQVVVRALLEPGQRIAPLAASSGATGVRSFSGRCAPGGRARDLRLNGRHPDQHDQVEALFGAGGGAGFASVAVVSEK